jgi:uncharacterized protein YcfJ
VKREFGILSLAVASAVTVGTWTASNEPTESQVIVPAAHHESLEVGSSSVELDLVAYRRRRYHRRHTYVHRRSGRKSAAIVGGSALGGAAIGALAGGGKGAAIGAIAGGGAGYIYDRKTHKKVVRE